MTPRRKLPPLNALRAFEVAGRRNSFRAAADELGVTQGAVAQQVRALEDHLGLTLFFREPQGVALTPRGTTFWAQINRAFDLLADATGALGGHSACVTISATPTVAARILVPRLAELQAELPDVALHTIADEHLPDFERGDVDIGIGLTRPPFAAGIEARVLIPQDIIAIASPRMALPAGPLDRAALMALPMIHHCLDHWPLFLGVTDRLSGPRFNQTHLALDAVIAGQGVAVAPRGFVAADLAAGRLVQVSDKVLRAAPDYYITRRTTPAPSPAADAVWRWCIDILTQG